MKGICFHGCRRLTGLVLIGLFCGAEQALAQQTNKPPRVFRYTGRIRLMTRPADLAAPVKTDEEAENSENGKPSTLLGADGAWHPPRQAVPPRPVNLKKEQDAEKTPWILQPSLAGETNAQPAQASGWGWLADEVDLVRKYSGPFIKGQEEANFWSNSVNSVTDTNGPARDHTGLVLDNGYQPALPLVAASAGVERVVSDVGLDELKKQALEKQNRAEMSKPGTDLSSHRDQFAGLVSTNETLGLARSKTEDPPPEGQPFQQTRAMLSEIIKPYMTGRAGGEASGMAPALQPGSPGMALLQPAGDTPKADVYNRMPPGAGERPLPGDATAFSPFRPAGAGGLAATASVNPAAAPLPAPPARHNLFETARPFELPRSSPLPAGAAWPAQRGSAPAGFTPTTLYANPLDVNRPSDAGH